MFTKKNILLACASIFVLLAFSAIRPEDADGWTRINKGLTSLSVRTLHSANDNLYAGTRAGVFKTDDKGENWLSAGLANNVIIALYSMNNILYVGTHAEGVFKTTDKGENWTNIGLTNIGIGALHSMEGILFAGTAGKGIFYTVDDGENWIEINNGLTYLDINTLNSINGVLYAGTSKGVFKTRDKGEYWINIGLSAVNALHSINGILYAGRTSQGIFRTSNKEVNWIKMNNGLTNLNTDALNSANGVLYAGFCDASGGEVYGGVYRINDIESNWINIGLIKYCVLTIHPMNGVLYAGTAIHGIFKLSLPLPHSTSWWDRNWKFVSIPLTIAGALGTVFGCYVNRKRLSLIKRIPGLLKQKRDNQNYQPLENI